MTCAKWLTVVGGLSLLIGLVTALRFNHYTEMTGLLAAKNPVRKGGLFDNPKDYARRWFYVGLGLTALGVILQTLGAILS